jgi:hypothetical protein
VALAGSLTQSGHVTLPADGGEVTAAGLDFLHDFGADQAAGKRVLCRPCLDRSERGPRIAGRVGAASAACYLEPGWVQRQRDSRAISVTQEGAAGFERVFGFTLRQT